MNSRTLIIAGILLLPAMIPAAAQDPLAPYKATQVSETVRYDINGRVTGKDVVRNSKVDVKENVVERYAADGHGGLRLVGRTTTVQDTQGNTVTTTEALLRPADIDLAVTGITTQTKDAAGGTVTTTEARNTAGNMLITSRIAVSRADGQTITTVEAPDKYGNLVVVSQTTTK